MMLKVAFATADRRTVNQHFGASLGFSIYAINADRARLTDVLEFAEAFPNAAAGAEDAGGMVPEMADIGRSHGRLGDKIAALADCGCAAVYCLAVGGSAVRLLLAAGVQPIRLDGETAIDDLLETLCAAVRQGGIPWIDRAQRRDGDDDRFARMADEAWQE